VDQFGVYCMDRPVLVGLCLLLGGVACLGPAPGPSAAADEPVPACDWRSSPLFEVVTSGLYLYQTGPLDSDWEDTFPTLLPKRDENYRCLQQLFERGPSIIPGLETEYARRVAQSRRTVPPLQKSGTDVAPVLAFLEPQKGREYLAGKIADPRWTLHDVAVIADSVWPRQSERVRRVLMNRLAKRPTPGEDVHRAVSELVRVSKPEDRGFVLARLDWVEPGAGSRLRLSLLSKHGETGTVAKVLRSNVPAEFAAAADALLQWGHIDVVCAHLRAESLAERANGIAGRYTSFRRGDYFSWLPDDVIVEIRKAPQAWECLPPSIKPSPFNAPRDTSKDLAATWHRPPLGRDAN